MPPDTVEEAQALKNEIDKLKETQPRKRSRKTNTKAPHQVTQKHPHQVILKVIVHGQQG